MAEDIKWHFPSNNYGKVHGDNDTDTGTYKGDKISGLAKEIIQNSIDAKKSDCAYVSVEFSLFEIDRSKIPGIDYLAEQLKRARELRLEEDDTAAAARIDRQLERIGCDKLKCLRISDFNTTGLYGISNEDPKGAYYHLIKGEGISNKSSEKGGSKGVGKNAAFVNSGIRTVFYSTYTERGESGYIGEAHFSSAKMGGIDSDEVTSGTGYYADGIKCKAIDGQFKLDPRYTRQEGKCGTDIYIIDALVDDGWEYDIIPKILDSFMCAFLYGMLEVKVGINVINQHTISHFINKDKYCGSQKFCKSIRGQFYALTSGISPFVFDVLDLGKAKLYFVDCSRDELQDYATKKCAMIRYPYMKIKDEPFRQYGPFAAVCIIDNNKLCSKLRDMEDSKHENFELDGPDEKAERLYNHHFYDDELLGAIRSYIESQLTIGESDTMDLVGSEDYLSDESDDTTSNPGSKKADNREVREIGHLRGKKRKARTPQATRLAVEDPLGESIIADILGEEDSDDDVLTPEGHNNGKGGPYHAGENLQPGKEEGDSKEGLKYAPLRGLKYRYAFINPEQKMHMIKFKSDFTVNNVIVRLRSITDSYSERDDIHVMSAKVNGVPVDVENNVFCISLMEGHDYDIRVVLDVDTSVSVEVGLYNESRQ